MTRMVTSFSALILSIILLVGGNAFLMTLLGVRLSLESVSPGVIGWILVCYSIGFVLGTVYVHQIISRVGHIRTFAAFAAMAAACALLYPMAVSEPFWAFLRALSGFSAASVMVVIESWFSSRATNANRGTLFAVYQIVFYLSVAGGQLLMNVGEPSSFVPFSLAAVLLTVALIPLALTRMEAPEVGFTERLSFFALARESFSGVAGALVCGVLIGAFYALGPVYATMVGLEVSRVSTFMASAIVAAMLLAWPIGWLCDRVDRRRVMSWVALTAAVAAALVVFFGADRLWLLTLLVAVFTGLSATLYPIAVAITNDRMENSRIVAASATLLLSYGVGSVVGPVVMAQMISIVGPDGLFLGSAGFLVLLVLATRYRIASTRDIAVADQEHFVPAMPEGSAALAEIDPRNEEFHEMHEALATGDADSAR